ncbi:MAG: molecular chaperone DnaJ [Chloroflexota bacterium]
MSAKRDYYDVLGVSRGASEDDIRRAFRRLARQYHPDVNKEPGAEARFKEINEAYEVLCDPQKRRNYDVFGHAGTRGFDVGAGGFENFGFEDIFETFFGMGRATTTRRAPQRGADLRYDLTISFEEAVFGCEKELEIPRWEQCGDCNGTGAEPGSQPTRCPKCNGSGELRHAQRSIFGQFVNITVCDRCHGEGSILTTPCQKCRGTGRVRSTRRIVVTIPAGVDDNARIRLSGEGEMGTRQGPRGDLYVHLNVQPHQFFKRQGNDLICEVPINFTQAALGDVIEIPTVDGPKAKVRIPAGTQSGSVFRVKDKGVPYLGSDGRGSLQVRVTVEIPKTLTEEQRALLVKLSKSFGLSVTPQDGKRFLGKVKDVLGVE